MTRPQRNAPFNQFNGVASRGIHVKALIQNGSTGGSLTLQTTLGGTSIQMLANSVCTLVQAN